MELPNQAPEPIRPQQPAGERTIRGQVRPESVGQPFRGAILTIELFRTQGPAYDARGEKVAELRFFDVHWDMKNPGRYIPFTFGDFAARPGANYNLQVYFDMNANGRRDGGDYWNDRVVPVELPQGKNPIQVKDFAPVHDGRVAPH